MKIHSSLVVLLLLIVVLQLAACARTPPARFYSLSSLDDSTHRNAATDHARKVIAIGPVALAKYLEHPAITTRSGATTLKRSELDRWGGPLGDEITRVLVENMAALVSAEGALVLPWLESSDVDYRLQLHITRFDGPLEGPVTFNAAWMIFAGNRNELAASGEISIAEPVEAPNYAAFSEAMSRALAELSRRVAAEIDAVHDAADMPVATRKSGHDDGNATRFCWGCWMHKRRGGLKPPLLFRV
ncbi:MAG: PqiC family protein [Thermodesulfobacteriota bacterium]|nr:PqiC family protein [Thermodesulfobacteriota bacterium]